MKKRKSKGFLNLPPKWQKFWRSMPSFSQDDLTPLQTIPIHFATREARDEFSKLVGQPLTDKTQSIWFPKEKIGRYANKRYVSDDPLQPRYPVYVISKGRAETRLTAKALEKIGVLYRIVVEPQEFDEYAAVIAPAKILKLPFSNLGEGSIPARNWVWEHSIEEGSKRHWILDDNIRCFYRLDANLKVPISCGNIFRAAEDFVDRYENVAISGFNYFMFAARKTVVPPLYFNTRIYSCILIQNDIEYRWRGRYNEDTDLSLRCLKDGWCTILFNAFLAEKMQTMTMSGGNTEDLYEGDGRFDMADSLREQHPDVVKVVYKWGRWQHSVDYSRFVRNQLIPRSNVPIPDIVDNYGMRLQEYESNPDEIIA